MKKKKVMWCETAWYSSEEWERVREREREGDMGRGFMMGVRREGEAYAREGMMGHTTSVRRC